MKLRGFRNQCPTCSEYFNSNYVFDKHRVGKAGSLNRRCRTREEMLQKGWSLNSHGFWVSSVKGEALVERIKHDTRR